jgi:hypothetical protein
LSHGFAVNGHGAPAVQAPQTPLLQTSLLVAPPQWVPVLLAFGPMSAHVWTPVAQVNWPMSQVLLGTHVPPGVHALHAPLLHTLLTPHLAPLPTFAVVSTQTGWPLEHEIPPTWQGLAGVQSAPPVQAMHFPAEQTRFLPHGEPLGAFVTVSTQADCPLAHDVTPVWQGLAGTQPRLVVHALQLPASQTMLVPHPAPLAAGVIASVHVATPPEQELTIPL